MNIRMIFGALWFLKKKVESLILAFKIIEKSGE